MNVLAIETSCDETAAAVIADGRVCVERRLVAIGRPSALWRRRARAGGAGASDGHRARCSRCAERRGPRVGRHRCHRGHESARTEWRAARRRQRRQGIALARNLPLVGVHHIEGHIAANWLIDDLQDYGEIAMPAVCLIVSGGHTDLIRMSAPGEYELLGTTLDDAAGEAFERARGCLVWDIPAARPFSTRLKPVTRPRFRSRAPGSTIHWISASRA